tara:strand:+ start:7792 stop:8514 length:723 start_codon:yes stop_codon:yes gene_type:complete
MEELGNIFRNLGKSYTAPEQKIEPKEDYDKKLNDIQAELYGTIDALLARVRALEQQVAELTVELKDKPDGNFTNIFDIIPPEELLGRAPKPIEPLEADEVTSIKGFVAPVPQNRVERAEALTAEIQEVDLPEDEESDLVKPDFDDATLDMYDILDDDDPNHLDASEIITYIESYGGILNQEMKKKEVMRDDISDKDRKEVYLLLEKCGVKTYKANKFRTFFYFGTEEEGKEKYEAYMSSK